jgi:hypothetical protein
MPMPYLALQPLADLLLCPVKEEQLTQEILPGVIDRRLAVYVFTDLAFRHSRTHHVLK